MTTTQSAPTGMKAFGQKLQEQLLVLCATGKLFRSKITGDKVWELYLASFGADNNPIFRDPNSTEKNCNNCHNFIRRYGNIVAVDSNNKIITLFDVQCDVEYAATADTLNTLLKNSPIGEVFFETLAELMTLPYESCSKKSTKFQLGLAVNYKKYTKEEAEKFGVVKPDEIRTFDHMHVFLPAAFVDTAGASVESIMGSYRDSKNVFQRAMEQISLDTLKLVSDLIKQGSLLNGDAHLFKIDQIIPMKEAYDALAAGDRDAWCWATSYKLPFAKFRNEAIGTLCVELSEGKELNSAVQMWNKMVDPINYMRATAPITKKQIEEAEKFVEENGYSASFSRRFATMEDISVSEILHANAGDGKIKSVTIFDKVKATSTRHKRSEFDGLDEVGIEKFMKDILPGCTSIEAFLANSQQGNLVSLTTADNPDSKPIFKWSNNYSWTFNGNLAGKSEIKEAVKSQGGNVEGVLRSSMVWNESGSDESDLDLWCTQPDQSQIGYNTGYRKDSGGRFSSCGGQLDLDNTGPGRAVGVENIYFPAIHTMKPGVYTFFVNQYSDRGSKGFKFEIEFEGEIYQYEFVGRVSGKMKIAEVTLKDGQFSIKHFQPATEGGGASKEIYGIETNQFHKVNLMCVSPNHWAPNNVGNKHYFFMLEGCKAPDSIRGFHNENLIPELLTHRKVMEVLGASSMIPASDKQLSGLGFNATVRDELIVKLGGTHKRMLKIQF